MLFHWYHTHGLVIENITAFAEYKPVRLFTEEVADAQRAADANISGNMAGNTQ